MSQKRKRTSPHQIPDLRVGALSFRICFCQSQDGAAGTCGICTHIALGVGAAGGATKATVATVLKAKGHAHQSAVAARASWTEKVRQGPRSGLKLFTDPVLDSSSGKRTIRGLWGKKKPTALSGRKKGDVNVGSSSGSPVRSSACRIAKRHERHQTPAPSCLDATMGTGLPPSQVLPDANQDTVPTND